MSAIAQPASHAPVGHGSGVHGSFLDDSRGFVGWMTTVDHKKIGLLYLVSILAAFLLGGLFAVLVRTELIAPGPTIMSDDWYNRMFTLHGAIMVFMFIIPGIPAALGNFVMPIMIGAKDVAFPRLNLASYYFWLVGSAFLVISVIVNAVDTGWTFYTPYSTSTTTAVIPVALGVFILGFSSILTGLNFIVTIHKLRAPGLTWFKLPLFVWSIYATAIIQVLATPVIGITVLLLIVERLVGLGIFDPKYGGDPVLFQHFFWFYSHPAVYIMILPGMGIISELITTHSKKHIFGYNFVAFSSVAIAIFGFLVWGHHMFTSGQSPMMNMVFSALTYSVSIPTAIKIFNWTATLYKGSIRLTTPMLYALSFMFLFSIGGLTGLFLGALATDVHLHDTYFVVAHFHYVMFGGTVIAFLGGLHHWWPKMTGRLYNEYWGRLSCLLIFVGFNATFFPQFVAGAQGMTRRYYDYVDQFHSYHAGSTIGSYILTIAFLIAAANLLHSWFRGEPAPDNPWGGASLEWQTPSPPPTENFTAPPRVGDPYDYSDLVLDKKSGGYVRQAPQGAA